MPIPCPRMAAHLTGPSAVTFPHRHIPISARCAASCVSPRQSERVVSSRFCAADRRRSISRWVVTADGIGTG